MASGDGGGSGGSDGGGGGAGGSGALRAALVVVRARGDVQTRCQHVVVAALYQPHLAIIIPFPDAIRLLPPAGKVVAVDPALHAAAGCTVHAHAATLISVR